MFAFSSSSTECQNQFHFDPDKISLLKFSPNEHKNVFMSLGFVKKKKKKYRVVQYRVGCLLSVHLTLSHTHSLTVRFLGKWVTLLLLFPI